MSNIYYALSNALYKFDIDDVENTQCVYTAQQGSIKSITAIVNNVMYLLVRSSPGAVDYRSIYKLDFSKTPLEAVLYYEHPNQIANLELRNINGQEKLYFSAYMQNDWSAEIAIYHLLSNNVASVYYRPQEYALPLPNPCTNEESDGSWRGGFAFDANNNLYICTGNVAPGGLYKVSHVNEMSAQGQPERLYVHQYHGIWELAYMGDNKILFFHSVDATHSDICCLDLNTLQTTTVKQIDTGLYNVIADISYNASLTAWYKFKKSIIKLIPKKWFLWNSSAT